MSKIIIIKKLWIFIVKIAFDISFEKVVFLPEKRKKSPEVARWMKKTIKRHLEIFPHEMTIQFQFCFSANILFFPSHILYASGFVLTKQIGLFDILYTIKSLKSFSRFILLMIKYKRTNLELIIVLVALIVLQPWKIRNCNFFSKKKKKENKNIKKKLSSDIFPFRFSILCIRIFPIKHFLFFNKQKKLSSTFSTFNFIFPQSALKKSKSVINYSFPPPSFEKKKIFTRFQHRRASQLCLSNPINLPKKNFKLESKRTSRKNFKSFALFD